jgi:hypothetical protein
MIHRTLASSLRAGLGLAALTAPLLAAIACGNAPTEALGSGGSAVSAPTMMITPSPYATVKGTYPGEGVPAYQGGSILTGTVHIQPIFYGTAWQPNYQSKMTAFLQALPSTSYWQVVQEYTDSKGNHPGGIYVNTPDYVTSYPLGRSLTSADIQTIIQDQVTAGQWPIGEQYLYMVFTADDVDVSDSGGALCTTYMGWHWAADFSWTNLIPATITEQVPYAFIGSPQYCINHPTGVAASADAGVFEWNASVNGTAIDEAITAAEHEAAEAFTDPYPLPGQYGWNPEIGDICAWIPGPSTLASGKYSDLGSGEPYKSTQVGYASNETPLYLVQTIWDVNQNGCAYGPANLDALTQTAACGNWQCGTASNGAGGVYYCGKGCAEGQTCSSAHVCTGKACSTPAQCCIDAGGVWTGKLCE